MFAASLLSAWRVQSDTWMAQLLMAATHCQRRPLLDWNFYYLRLPFWAFNPKLLAPIGFCHSVDKYFQYYKRKCAFDSNVSLSVWHKWPIDTFSSDIFQYVTIWLPINLYVLHLNLIHIISSRRILCHFARWTTIHCECRKRRYIFSCRNSCQFNCSIAGVSATKSTSADRWHFRLKYIRMCRIRYSLNQGCQFHLEWEKNGCRNHLFRTVFFFEC